MSISTPSAIFLQTTEKFCVVEEKICEWILPAPKIKLHTNSFKISFVFYLVNTFLDNFKHYFHYFSQYFSYRKLQLFSVGTLKLVAEEDKPHFSWTKFRVKCLLFRLFAVFSVLLVPLPKVGKRQFWESGGPKIYK